jgi:hypothetical protein
MSNWPPGPAREAGPSEFEPGDPVRIAGDPGYYVWMGPNPDGSASVYGGSKNPHGRRQHRATRAEVRPDDRVKGGARLVEIHKAKKRALRKARG